MVLFSGCTNISDKTSVIDLKVESNKIINKDNDECALDTDCKYIGYTGGCHTQEYVNKIQKEAKETGTFITEAPVEQREKNVGCECLNNKCK